MVYISTIKHDNMIDLNAYDLIIVNSSGGKDSICALWKVVKEAEIQGFDKDKIVVSHQDLGEAEWAGTYDLVKAQSAALGIKQTIKSKRVDRYGHEESFLEYVERRGAWPSNKQRWCTSDFKRGPGARVVTALTKGLGECKVLYVFGFRSEESPARAKKETLKLNKRITTKKRTVHEWLPIHDWSTAKVWSVIKGNNLPYHKAYDLGMPRLSCVFCIFSPKDALVIAGKENPELLDKYVEVEERINHTFQQRLSLREVKDAIAAGYEPQNVENWTM